jgi:hypothetical protein
MMWWIVLAVVALALVIGAVVIIGTFTHLSELRSASNDLKDVAASAARLAGALAAGTDVGWRRTSEDKG